MTAPAAAGTVEKAVYFLSIDELLAWDEDCDRFYFGQEFCQRLLPTVPDLMRAVERAASRNLGFTLVTPFVTNAGMARVKELVRSLPDNFPEGLLEVVVNDWGVLSWLHRERPVLPLALGRLLVKQKRGPSHPPHQGEAPRGRRRPFPALEL